MEILFSTFLGKSDHTFTGGGLSVPDGKRRVGDGDDTLHGAPASLLEAVTVVTLKLTGRTKRER